VYLGKWLKSDVVKVSHHGSRTSSSEDFLRIADPEIGVISVEGTTRTATRTGKPWRVSGRRVYRTDREGAVKVTETPGGLAVKTYRDFPFKTDRKCRGRIEEHQKAVHEVVKKWSSKK